MTDELRRWHGALAVWDWTFTELVWDEAADEPATLRWIDGQGGPGEARWGTTTIWVFDWRGWRGVGRGRLTMFRTDETDDPVVALARIKRLVEAERALTSQIDHCRGLP